MRNMYEVLQIYEEIRASDKYSFLSFWRLYMILCDLGMGEQQIMEVLELAKHHQLEYLQDNVEYLRNEVDILEAEKTKSTKDILVLDNRIDELNAAISFLIKQRKELAHMNQTLGSSNFDSRNEGGIEISWRYPELNYFDDKQMSDRY